MFSIIYVAFAAVLLLPALLHWGEVIPGAEISDVWNALWSLEFVSQSVQQWTPPTCTETLNFPKGGCLWPSDLIGATIAVPLRFGLSLSQSYSLVVLLQLSLIGWSTDRLHHVLSSNATRWQRGLSGIMMMSSASVAAAIHNGSSEALSLGWVILGMVGAVEIARGHRRGVVWLVLSTFSSWYGVVGLLIFVGCYGWYSWTNQRNDGIRLLRGVGLWMMVLLPYAWWVQSLSTGEENVLLIKGAAEAMQVRRTIGSADPLAYFIPWDYRSPDFQEISRYKEQFVHAVYLGWVGLVAIAVQWRSCPPFLKWMFGIGLLLALGPVLVVQGEPVVWNERWGIPLPYFLFEFLPGFSGLTLLYRLAFVPMLCIALVTPRGLSNKSLLLVGGLWLCEQSLLSPDRDIPSFTAVPTAEEWGSLKEAPAGGVAHYPIVGGTETLYLQTIHQKPVAGTLNFVWSRATEKIVRTAQKSDTSTEMVRRVGNVARQTGLRYLVIDTDQSIMPDMYTKTIRQMQTHFPTVGSAKNDYIVLQLW